MPPTPDELRRWDREVFWHSFTQMRDYEPLIVDRAQGCTLTDVDGRQFIDGVSSLWCNVHGHRHPRIDAAIRRQLDQVAHVTSLGMSNPAPIELAKRLCELAPNGLEHVFFASDGSSAVEVAVKMALQYWRQRTDPRPAKTKYLAFDNAYHGDTLGSVSVGGVARFHAMFEPLLFEVIRIPAPDEHRRPDGVAAADATDHYLSQLESVLREHAAQLAALVIEPHVQCAAGMLMHPPGYLRGARELTRRHDVLLIADEVAVGFGRTGRMFACEHEQVAPDFLCLGKGLTGGYLPMSATLTTTEVWNAFLGEYHESKSFFHGHTYGGNPLSAAAALASLEIFEQERTLEQVGGKTELLGELLAPLKDHPHVGGVRQRGLIAAVELTQDKATNTGYPWSERRGQRVCDFALKQGVWLRPLGNVVVIMPPLSISDEELAKIVDAVRRGVDEAVD